MDVNESQATRNGEISNYNIRGEVKMSKSKKLIAKINALQEQRKEISKEINKLNAALRQITTMLEWYEVKGFEGGIIGTTHDVMDFFWDAAADQARYYVSEFNDNIEPDFDPSSEQIFITCLHCLDSRFERLADESASGPVLKVADAIQQLRDKLFRVKKK
jgi:hypothetical protein